MSDSQQSKDKQFIIQYDPSYSLGKMFEHFDQALAGKKYLQPKNVVVCHDLATIYSTITKNRLDLLTFLVAKQPENIYQLAQLLKRPYAHVWNDCQILNGLGAIELKKTGKEKGKEKIKPIALYERVVFNFPIKEIVDLYNQKNTEKILPVRIRKELLMNQVKIEKSDFLASTDSRKTNQSGIMHV